MFLALPYSTTEYRGMSLCEFKSAIGGEAVDHWMYCLCIVHSSAYPCFSLTRMKSFRKNTLGSSIDVCTAIGTAFTRKPSTGKGATIIRMVQQLQESCSIYKVYLSLKKIPFLLKREEAPLQVIHSIAEALIYK
jgi:hypothetical protein